MLKELLSILQSWISYLPSETQLECSTPSW